MGTPELTKGERTRMKILEAAIGSFVRLGFEGASVTEITAAAAVNRGLVTHYFKNKDALLWEALEHVVESGSKFTDQFNDDRADIKDPMERYIRAMFGWYREHPNHLQFLWLCMQRGSYDEQYRDRVNGIFTNARRKLTKLVDSEGAATIAFQIHAQLVGLIFTAIITSREQLSKHEEACVEIARAIMSRA